MAEHLCRLVARESTAHQRVDRHTWRSKNFPMAAWVNGSATGCIGQAGRGELQWWRWVGGHSWYSRPALWMPLAAYTCNQGANLIKFARESRDCQESVPKHSGIHCSTSSPHCIWSARRPVLHSRRAGTASQTILFYIRSPTPYHQTTKHVTSCNYLEPVNDYPANFARITAAQVMVMNLEEWRS